MFAAVSTNGRIVNGAIITFSQLHANIGSGLDKDTGLFNVPISGLYRFYFSAMTATDHHFTYVYVVKNDVKTIFIHHNDRNDDGKNPNELLSYIWTMELNKGDTIKLKVENNALLASGHYPIFYSGELLIEG